MKKNEIALIILIVSVAAVATYFTVAAFLPPAGKNPVEVEQAEVIESTVVKPSATVFNKDAINPTVKVSIGNQSNQQPFTIGQ
jgi:hypothetical protein